MYTGNGLPELFEGLAMNAVYSMLAGIWEFVVVAAGTAVLLLMASWAL